MSSPASTIDALSLQRLPEELQNTNELLYIHRNRWSSLCKQFCLPLRFCFPPSSSSSSIFFIFLSHPFFERERRVAGGGTSPQITTPTRVPQLVNALTPQFFPFQLGSHADGPPDALRGDGFSRPVFPPLALVRVTSASHRLALAPVTSSPLRCSVREKKKAKKKKSYQLEGDAEL